jgi:hypothetical protein
LPEESFSVAPDAGELAGYLLAWTTLLAFCSGLVGLAVSSQFEVSVPRWLILAYGVGCALLAVLALVLSRPWQQHQPSAGQGPCAWKHVNVDRWAATWNGAPVRDAGAPRR